jgi:hypothetical protein
MVNVGNTGNTISPNPKGALILTRQSPSLVGYTLTMSSGLAKDGKFFGVFKERDSPIRSDTTPDAAETLEARLAAVERPVDRPPAAMLPKTPEAVPLIFATDPTAEVLDEMFPDDTEDCTVEDKLLTLPRNPALMPLNPLPIAPLTRFTVLSKLAFSPLALGADIAPVA